MENEIVLTKLEEQLLLYDILYNCKVTEYIEITNLLPISKKTIQRDIADLTDAGLVSVVFSRKENGYIHVGEPAFNESVTDEKRRKHLEDLWRMGILMQNLTSNWDEIYEEPDGEELCGWEDSYTAVDSYLELFPNASEEDWKRDFEILDRMYDCVSCTEGGNYSVGWLNEEPILPGVRGDGQLCSSFGVYKDGKKLKKKRN